MLQNLSEEIRECLCHAEHCKQLSKTALPPPAIKGYLEMEQRWLALARSYEFAERLSRFTEPFRKRKQPKSSRQPDEKEKPRRVAEGGVLRPAATPGEEDAAEVRSSQFARRR